MQIYINFVLDNEARNGVLTSRHQDRFDHVRCIILPVRLKDRFRNQSTSW